MPIPPGRPSARADAALALAALLLLLALPAPRSRVAPCPAPAVARPDGASLPELRCRAAGRADALAGAAPLLFGRPLDLNRAPPEALEALPGIGPVRARAIADARRERAFCAPGDLLRVRGIGARTLARLADRVHATCGREPRGGGPLQSPAEPVSLTR